MLIINTHVNTRTAYIRTWDLRGVNASGGDKRERGEGGWGGHEKVEDADDLVEEVVRLVGGVEGFEISNRFLS